MTKQKEPGHLVIIAPPDSPGITEVFVFVLIIT